MAARGNKPGDTDGDGVPDQFDRKRAAANNANNGYLSGAGNLKYATPHLFRGRVTDANGNALGFTKIANVRDNVGTYTDAKGKLCADFHRFADDRAGTLARLQQREDRAEQIADRKPDRTAGRQQHF